MDTDALSSLLSNPDALANLVQTASSLFGQPQPGAAGGQDVPDPPACPEPPERPERPERPRPSTPDPAAELTGKLLPMLTAIAQSSHCDSDSDRLRMLTALKPFISQKSCDEIDHAVRLLGMARMARAAMGQLGQMKEL
ncbi:MAG: hypothetical protein ACI4PQ_06575 [Butyricicoccaceae bacterium]